MLPVRAADPSNGAPAAVAADTGIDRIIITGGSDERAQELNPGTSTRIYRLGPETIEDQGRGQDAGLDAVLLHAPGVSRESGGQYHLRGEDYGLQYRLNGIELPEGIAPSLGQPFDTRLIQNLTIVDGALPAQYGLRNAGVIDLQAKSGADLSGGDVASDARRDLLARARRWTPHCSRAKRTRSEFTADYRQGPCLLYGNVALAETRRRDINSAQGLFDADERSYVANHDIHTDYDQLWTISAGAAYRSENVTLHSDLLFGSGFYGETDNADQLPAHYTVNLGVAYTAMPWRQSSLTLRFDVVNLFNQSYLLHDAGIGATINQYRERRGFFGGARLAF